MRKTLKRSRAFAPVALAIVAAVTMAASPASAAGESYFGDAWGVQTTPAFGGGPSSFTRYGEVTLGSASGGVNTAHASGFNGSGPSFRASTGAIDVFTTGGSGVTDAGSTVNAVDFIVGTYPPPPCDLIQCVLNILFPPPLPYLHFQADVAKTYSRVDCIGASGPTSSGSTTFTNVRVNGNSVAPATSPNYVVNSNGFVLTFNVESEVHGTTSGRPTVTRYEKAVTIRHASSTTEIPFEIASSVAYVKC